MTTRIQWYIHAPIYIENVPNRGARPTILLRIGERNGKKTDKRTLANLSHWPAEQVEALRRVLRGAPMVPADSAYAVERSLPHGHVEALLGVMRQLDIETLLASRPCRERALVLAMLAQRLVDPCSKLATTRQWHATTLAEQLNVADANRTYVNLDGRTSG